MLKKVQEKRKSYKFNFIRFSIEKLLKIFSLKILLSSTLPATP